MKAQDLYKAVNEIDDNTIIETVDAYCGRKAVRRPRKVFRTILAAAVAVSVFAALGAAAYAGDFLGIRALLSGKFPEDGGEAAVSITAPQTIPEDVSDDIRAELENNGKAWEEWENYRENEAEYRMPEALKNLPEDYTYIDEKYNGDCTYTLSFIKADYDESAGKYINEEILYSAELTISEYDSWKKLSKGVRYGDYDYSYGVICYDDQEEIVSIAEKYGLSLRGKRQDFWSSEDTGMT